MISNFFIKILLKLRRGLVSKSQIFKVDRPSICAKCNNIQKGLGDQKPTPTRLYINKHKGLGDQAPTINLIKENITAIFFLFNRNS